MINTHVSVRGLRLISVLVLSIMVLGFGSGPSSAGAQTLARYEGKSFGFAIEWDEEIWTGVELDEFLPDVEAIDFESVSSYGTVQAMAAEDLDAEACLAEMAASFSSDTGAGIEDFEPASDDLDLPEGLDDAATGLYGFTILDKDNEFGQIVYLSCSLIDGGDTILQIFMATNDNAYEDVIPEWDELIGGISFLEPAGTPEADGEDDGPVANSETSFEEGEYVNPAFGVELTWDVSLWLAEELSGADGEGVTVWTEYSYGTFRISESEAIDSDACLEFMAETFGTGENIHDFDNASRKIELPVSGLEGESDLYSLSMDSDGEPMEMYMYLECVPVRDGDGALMIMLVSSIEAYEDALPEFNDLLAGIEITEGTGQINTADVSTDENEAEAKDGSSADEHYENADLGFAVDWNAETWSGTPFDDEDGIGVVFESDIAYGILTAEESDLTTDECVQELAYQLESNQDYKKVRKAPSSMERAEVPSGVAVELFTMVDKNSPTKYAILFACGPTSTEGVMLNGRFLTVASDWEAALPAIQELIDGVDVSPIEVSDDEKDDVNDEKTELESVTTPQFEVEMSFDPELWEVEDLSDDEMDNVSLISDLGRFTVIAYESDEDVESCVESLVDNEQDFALDDVQEADGDFERPELGEDSAGELYAYTYDGQDGPLEVIVYLECRSAVEGESVIGIAIFTSIDTWNDALPEYQSVLDSIEAA